MMIFYVWSSENPKISMPCKFWMGPHEMLKLGNFVPAMVGTIWPKEDIYNIQFLPHKLDCVGITTVFWALYIPWLENSMIMYLFCALIFEILLPQEIAASGGRLHDFNRKNSDNWNYHINAFRTYGKSMNLACKVLVLS